MAHNNNTSSTDKNGPSPWFNSIYYLFKYASTAMKRTTYVQESSKVLRHVTTSDALHVLHINPEDGADQILRLHMFIHTNSKQQAHALVVVDCKTVNCEGFSSAMWVMQQHLGNAQQCIFKGSGYIWNNIILIKGTTDGCEMSKAISRTELSLDKVSRQSRASSVVWHACTNITLLSRIVKDVKHWRNSFGRTTLKAVIVSQGLSMDRPELRACSGLPNVVITKDFLSSMQSLSIPVIFVDAYMLGINSHLVMKSDQTSACYHQRAPYLPRFNEAFPCLLPQHVYEPIMKANMDDLAINIYRLAAKRHEVYGDAVVTKVKEQMQATRTSWWTKRIVDQNEFSQDRVQRSATKHLLNIAPNVDAPMHFKLMTLPSALLDRGHEMDGLTALRCEFDVQELKLRISTSAKDHPSVHILVSHNNRKVIERFHTAWAETVHTLLPAEQQPRIERRLAGHWLYLVKALHKQIHALYADDTFMKLNDEEQVMLKRIYWSLMNGNMTQIATGSLGSNPHDWWHKSGK